MPYGTLSWSVECVVVRLSQRLVVSHHTEMPKLTDNIPMTGEQLNTKPRKVQFLLSGRPGGVIGRALEWRYKGEDGRVFEPCRR